MNAKRIKSISFRLTEEEYGEIDKAAAAGDEPNNWCRQLYELAKILGHSNIKMTERYAKLAKQHIARTSGTARELWKILEPKCANAANVG